MAWTGETDLGTPAPAGDDLPQVTLSIDGRPVTVAAGTSVMRAAAQIETAIPKLCATDSVSAFGSCRLCLVEIEGRAATQPAAPRRSRKAWWCTPRPDKLKQLRRGVMELYISDHPLDCLTCAANGDCELQDQAGAVGLRDVRYGYEGASHLGQRKRRIQPLFRF